MSNLLFSNRFEASPGLTIDDLNKYLSAVQSTEDILLTKSKMKEGLFLSDCLSGLKKVPDESIDLIISEPTADHINIINSSNQFTLQDHYKWNNNWLLEAKRVLKSSGSIYLMTDWKYSSMYHSLLSSIFRVRSRIIWRNSVSKSKQGNEWSNDTSDIWFASKTDEYVFRNDKDYLGVESKFKSEIKSNLWTDIPKVVNGFGKYSQKIYSRILRTSSYNLNWILDPFMCVGDVGVACKTKGRRFIGFETDKDNLLLSMKRVENS